MSIQLSTNTLKTRESTSGPWEASSVIVQSDLDSVLAITGDGVLDPSFTATDLTGAANELNSALTNLDAGGVEYDSSESYSSGTVGAELTSQKNTLSHKADVIYDTASGDIASFPDGADGLPVKDLTVGIEPVQDLHGQASPYPPGGGKNLIRLTVDDLKTRNTSGSWSNNSYTVNGVTFTILVDNASNVEGINVNGTAAQETVFILDDHSFFEGDGALFLLGCPPGGSSSTYRLCVWRPNQGENIDVGSGADVYRISTEIRHLFRIILGASTSVSNIVFKPAFILSTSEHTFAPYSNICPISGRTGCNISHSGEDTSDPTVIPISWQSSAGTVYGGTLDVTSGVLTVDRVSKKLSDFTTVNRYQFDNIYAFVIAPMGKGIDATPVISSSYKSYGSNNSQGSIPNKAIKGRAYDFAQVLIRDDDYTSWSDLIADHGNETFVYYLATPQTYQLDPVTVTTLLGQNNIWVDCGPSTVEYPCDTKLYIDKKLAALVAALS